MCTTFWLLHILLFFLTLSRDREACAQPLVAAYTSLILLGERHVHDLWLLGSRFLPTCPCNRGRQWRDMEYVKYANFIPKIIFITHRHRSRALLLSYTGRAAKGMLSIPASALSPSKPKGTFTLAFSHCLQTYYY